MSDTAASPAPRAAAQDHRPLALLAAGMVVAAAVAAWLLVTLDSGGSSARTTGPVLVSAAELQRLAASVDHPVFWAGPRKDSAYELTVTPGGRVFVRYLPPHVAAGDPRPAFLTVGTYPSVRPYASLARAARADDAVGLRLRDGTLALLSRRAPRSVYLAQRGRRYQVEVYDPSLDTARNLVLSGSIRPLR